MSDQRSAAEQLTDFEDFLFGKDATRVNGEIERGHGSVFQKLPGADRARHAELENLIVLESAVRTAKVAADAAQAKLDAATQAHGSAAERLSASSLPPAGIDVSA